MVHLWSKRRAGIESVCPREVSEAGQPPTYENSSSTPATPPLYPALLGLDHQVTLPDLGPGLPSTQSLLETMDTLFGSLITTASTLLALEALLYGNIQTLALSRRTQLAVLSGQPTTQGATQHTVLLTQLTDLSGAVRKVQELSLLVQQSYTLARR